MNRRFFFALLAAFAALLGPMCAADRAALTAKDLEQFTPISEGIRRASALTLYEGLPHQSWDAEQLKKELAAKKTIQLHAFPFYEAPLALAAEEVAALSKLSSAADSYWSYAGPKKCGGFHPDYCLSWKDGDATWQLLICFGCHEMKLYGPKAELIADLREDAFRAFEAILKKHRDQRPEPAR
jgi:hypothetical protein